ncbi:MAG TPA: hypothetical protein VFB62_15805 [Polyangiaceae bacterium]|nr:hypothetical protein [Polyangiaceae bacterium]
MAAEPSELERARQAYDRGAAAYDRGEYVAAAKDLALADELVPSSIALTTAIKATTFADDPLLGMELVKRAESRSPADEALTDAATAAREKFEPRVGRLSCSCGVWPQCRASVDGMDAAIGVARWVTVGEHRVIFTMGATRKIQVVRIEPRAEVTVTPPPPPAQRPVPHPKPVPDEASGISPVWFWVTLGITAALGAGTIASAVDWKAKHDDFVAGPTDEKSVEGQAVETRTNVLIGVTAGGAVAAGVLGFVTFVF